MENQEIRDTIKKYNLKYADILPFLDNFSHINRISEELVKPLSEERQKEYLLAIKRAKEKKMQDMMELYKN